MEGLHELCSAELKTNKKSFPGGGGGGGGVSSGIGEKKNQKKKKQGLSGKVVSDQDWGPPKKNRSFGSHDGDGTDRPRQSTSRSTRSSPSMADYDSSGAADEKPSKKRKVEKIAGPLLVLKVPPAAFPKELDGGKDLDPSTPKDLTTIFTPDGVFSVDDPVSSGCRSGVISFAQKYQDMIPYHPATETHFTTCATCRSECGDDRVACKLCPRSYHCKCIDQSCRPINANDSACESEEIVMIEHKNGETMKRGCQRCELDTVILPEEVILSGMDALNKTPEKLMIEKSYHQYKDVSKSYVCTSLILVELLLILNKLMAFDYGEIFAAPG